MDKHEYRLKTEQMLKYLKNKSYADAYEIAETIDWGKVKNVAILCAVSEIYEYMGEYQKGRDILFLAYDRSPESKKIVYRLGILALKMGETKEAMDCYEEFVALAPKDTNRFVFKYKILKSKNAPLEEQIAVLEELKKAEYVEKWAFELAKLYHDAGMLSECMEECDDLILWFSEGEYIYKAMELKMQYKPLTPMQQEKYANRPQAVATTVEEESVEEAQEEETIVEEDAVEVPADVPADDTPEEEPVEEPTEETPAEDVPTEVSEEEAPTIEEEQDKPSLSIEEIVQDWEEKQKENAQMIQAEFERVEQERAQNESEVVEEDKEEILSDDVRRLMEELEAESAEIEAQKTAVVEETVEEPETPAEEQKPLLQKVVEQLAALDVLPAAAPAEVETPVEVPQAVEVIEPIEDLDEEEDGIKLGDTQSVALSAKALGNTTRVIVPQSEIPVQPVIPVTTPVTPISEGDPQDTGFVVQGRYDLDAQSEIGLKAGLTEDQKKLFSYFVPVHGMSEQLVQVLEHDKACKSRYGTSRIGNILVIGRRGSGKTVLAVDIVKAIQKARKMKQGKVAIVTAEALNKKDIHEIVAKLQGGALIVERASRMKRRTIDTLCEVMEGQTGELLVVLEDERKPIEHMMAEFPNFSKKFTSRVELPVFINDELVTFGQTYAKENGYKIDEMGILALYSDIDILQREERVVTVTDVKAIIDDAIENANRTSMKKIFKKMLGKNKDESDRILLKEEDFR